MRDFGFWVRVIAITQLFAMVLSNYGDQWLASDNPIIVGSEQLVSDAQGTAAAPDLSAPVVTPPAVSYDEELRAERWGGMAERESLPEVGSETEDTELSAGDDLEPDGSEWGGAPQP